MLVPWGYLSTCMSPYLIPIGSNSLHLAGIWAPTVFTVLQRMLVWAIVPESGRAAPVGSSSVRNQSISPWNYRCGLRVYNLCRLSLFRAPRMPVAGSSLQCFGTGCPEDRRLCPGQFNGCHLCVDSQLPKCRFQIRWKRAELTEISSWRGRDTERKKGRGFQFRNWGPAFPGVIIPCVVFHIFSGTFVMNTQNSFLTPRFYLKD